MESTIEPEALGVLGNETIYKQSPGTTGVDNVHYKLDSRPEDDAIYAAWSLCLVTDLLLGVAWCGASPVGNRKPAII